MDDEIKAATAAASWVLADLKKKGDYDLIAMFSGEAAPELEMVKILKQNGFPLKRIWLVDSVVQESDSIVELGEYCDKVNQVTFAEMLMHLIACPPGSLARTACIGIHPTVEVQGTTSEGDLQVSQMVDKMAKSYAEIGKFFWNWLGWHQRKLAFAWRNGNVCAVTPEIMGVDNGDVLSKSLEEFGRKVLEVSTSESKCIPAAYGGSSTRPNKTKKPAAGKAVAQEAAATRRPTGRGKKVAPAVKSDRRR